jgi:hypothetical protein
MGTAFAVPPSDAPAAGTAARITTAANTRIDLTGHLLRSHPLSSRRRLAARRRSIWAVRRVGNRLGDDEITTGLDGVASEILSCSLGSAAGFAVPRPSSPARPGLLSWAPKGLSPLVSLPPRDEDEDEGPGFAALLRVPRSGRQIREIKG